MFYIAAGCAAVLAKELPGLIRRRRAREIAAFAVIFAAALYYALAYVFHFKPYTPLAELALLLDRLGVRYG
ncbi:MAG: hypothetical protein LBC38_05410 [Oscillospiraceae bacterium]|jgi:hypothetical protein|nr:hypothetical protein [Oscillospiraceae bacterium]